MIDTAELPDSMIEKIAMLEGTLIDAATGGSGDNALYAHLRRELVRDEELKAMLPAFVRSYRDLSPSGDGSSMRREPMRGGESSLAKPSLRSWIIWKEEDAP